MTPSGRGYYILDGYGRLWGTGDALPLKAHYDLHIGEDWAREFELTTMGRDITCSTSMVIFTPVVMQPL